MASEHPPEDQKENRERPSDQYGYPYDFAYQRTNEERRRWSKYKEQIKQRRDKFVVFAELHDKAFLAIGTAFIAIFTIIVAVSTFALWWATSDLVTDAVNTAQRQLRAYIGPYEMELTLYAFPTNGPDKPYGFIAHAEMRNFGQTPAYDLMIYADAKFDAPNAAPFKFPSSSNWIAESWHRLPTSRAAHQQRLGNYNCRIQSNRRSERDTLFLGYRLVQRRLPHAAPFHVQNGECGKGSSAPRHF